MDGLLRFLVRLGRLRRLASVEEKRLQIKVRLASSTSSTGQWLSRPTSNARINDFINDLHEDGLLRLLVRLGRCVHHPMRSSGELAVELVEVTTLSAFSGRKAMRSDTEPGSQASRTLRFDSMDPVSGNRQLQYHLKVHSNEIRH